MSQQDFKKLYEQFRQVVLSGAEDEAKKFLADHLKEFPEKMQGEILLAFFEEGLSKTLEDKKKIADFQKQGLAVMKDLEIAAAKAVLGK